MYDAQVHLYRNALAKEEIFDCSGDGSGHGDGDRLHAYELVTAVMCFTADRSIEEERRIDFHFGENGFIDLR